MIDYREIIDKELSSICNEYGFEWSDIHCEAFCVVVDGRWEYIWYDMSEDVTIEDYIKELLQIMGVKND